MGENGKPGGLLLQQEEDVCAVCGEGHSEDGNQIVFCDRCDLAVHQGCYGVDLIPDKEWFCRLCERGIDCRSVTCSLCGHGGGAFKPTTDGAWAHVHCAIWLPDVSFTSVDRLEEIDCTRMNPQRRTLKCLICQKKKAGPCVQCPVGKCHISFHPWCLLYADHPDVYVPPGEYEAYCKKHSPPPSERRPQVQLRVQPYYSSGNGKPPSGKLGKGKDKGAATATRGGAGPASRRANGAASVVSAGSLGGGGRRGGVGPMAKAGMGGRPPLPPGRSGRASPRPGTGGASVVSTEDGRGGGEESSYPPYGSTAAGGGGGGGGFGRGMGRGMGADGVSVPLFSEYPGQQLNEPLDLDHFWACVNTFFPEDMPREVLMKIRASILPVDAPLGSDSRAATADDPVFRMPRVQPAKGGNGADSDAEGGEEDEDEAERQSLWGGAESVAGGGGGEEGAAAAATVAYEGDEEVPADAFLNQLRRRLELRCPSGAAASASAAAEGMAGLSLAEAGGGKGSPAKERERGSKKGEPAASQEEQQQELQVAFRSQALPQQQLVCTYRHDRHAGEAGQPCCTDLALAGMAKGSLPSASGPMEAQRTLDVTLATPSWVELELMSHQQELYVVGDALRRRVDGALARILQEAEGVEARRRAAGDAERRYLKARTWKFVALGLGRGLQDQEPDFNKKEEEALPASWALQVDGRPPPPPPTERNEEEEEDDSICMVCFDGTSAEHNPIVFCDGCDVAVHQACYGLPEVPEGDFFCERCAGLMEQPDRAISCCLCPETHGGFKRTLDGKWVHLVCALTCPGARIPNLVDMGPVDLGPAATHINYAPAAPTPKALPPVAPPARPALAATAAAASSSGGGGGGGAKAEESAVSKEGEGEGDGAKAPSPKKEEEEEEEGGDGTQAATEGEAATPVDVEAEAEGVVEAPASAAASPASGAAAGEKEEEQGEQPPKKKAETAAVPKEDEGPTTSLAAAADASAPSEEGSAAAAAAAAIAVSDALVPASPAVACPAAAKGDQCGICGQSRGFTLRCSHAGCSARLHLLCAWFRGAYVSMSVTDRSFRGGGEEREEYPAGLALEAFCLAHCPPGKRDRGEQVSIRARYRLKENEAAAAAAMKRAQHHKQKQRAAAAAGGGRGFGPVTQWGQEALPPDSYERFSCAVCMAPKAPLLQLDEEEAEPGPETMACSKCGISVHKACYATLHDTIPPSTPEAEAAWVCESCIGEEQVGGTDLCAVCPRRGGLMLPSNDHRNVRWAHAFCAQNNAPLVFSSGKSPVLPEMTAVDVRAVTRDLKKFKCGICGRKGGLCQRCDYRGCSAQFHAVCAKLQNWLFVSQEPGEKPVVLCPGHIPEGIYRGFNGEPFDYEATVKARLSADRGRVGIDTVKRREKIKKQLWDAECAISEQRLKDLRTLLETRQLELADGRRLTDDRLAAYKDRLAPLLVPRAPEPAPPPFVPRPREKKAAAAAASEPTRASQRLKPELTVTIPPPTLAGRTTRSRTPQGGGAGAGSGPDTTTTSASAATTAGAASGGMVDLTGAPSGMSNPPPSDALDASAAGARGKRKRGPTPPPSALAEQPQPAPSAAKLGGAGGRRKAAAVKGEAGTEVMVEEDGAEGNPAEGPAGGAAAAPKGKGKAAAAAAAPASASAPVEVQEEEEEEELLGFKSARDRFDELSEQAGLEAAAALSGEGPGVWAAGARRVAVGGCAVDFEKSVALVLDPEAEMRRREGAAAAGAVGGGVGGSHKRQRSATLAEPRVTLDRKLLELVTALGECRDGSGRDVSATFEVSPDPEEFPDYYDAVQHPIDLETIRHRVQCLYYTTLHDFCRDVQQLVRNAKLFNAPRSEAYQDAELLRACFDAKRAEMAERDRAREQALQLQLLQQQGGGDGAGRNKRRRLGSDDLGSVASSSAGAVGPGAEPRQPEPQQQPAAVAAAPSFSSSSSSAAVVAGGPRRASGGRGGRSSPRNRKDAMQGLACSCCAALEAGAGDGDGDGAGVLQGPLHLCKECEERLAGNVLGARVEVLWPDDAVWYAGRVHDFDPVSGKHRVWYDDGEWEFVHLSEQEMRYLDPVPLAVPAAQAAAAAAAPMEGVEALPGGGKEGEGSTA